jgi:Zn finger protein HypA/HybF involved in hydrogenase expression
MASCGRRQGKISLQQVYTDIKAFKSTSAVKKKHKQDPNIALMETTMEQQTTQTIRDKQSTLLCKEKENSNERNEISYPFLCDACNVCGARSQAIHAGDAQTFCAT